MKFHYFYFNTTLVIVYPPSILNKIEYVHYFNTTLVIVYRHFSPWHSDSSRISIQLLLLFIKCKHWVKYYNSKFQYNSCYCLSVNRGYDFARLLVFQYNSCYCLSKSEFMITSHTTYFNTTLVIVYLSGAVKPQNVYFISIQLLLLFIQRISAILYFHYSHFP